MCAAATQAVTLKIYGTSDVTDSHIFSNVMQATYTNNTLDYHALGSGAAITGAEDSSQHVDVVIVHAPTLEAPFVSGGFSWDVGCAPPSCHALGRAIFYNDYVVVGPTSDPAHVTTSHTNNAAAGFQDIAAAGATSTATFMTRNDNSGTNVEEETIWGLTTGVTKQLALNGGGSATRYQPGSGGTFPSWYVPTNTTQSANLLATNACTGHVGCYTIVDRGTWQYESSQGHVGNLKIVGQLNSSGAPGGASLLTNPFHAYIVNSSTQKTQATDFLDYLTGSGFQNTDLPSYPNSTNPAAFSDAYAKISAPTIPTHAAANSMITISATLQYPPPVAQAIASMPVQLQSSPTGVTYTNVGAPANTNASGVVTFTPTIGASTTYYRLSMGTFDSTALASRFSANTNKALGTTGVGKVLVP